jgi:hypothetical protein
MASIGIILRADKELDDLPGDWIPEPLGLRDDVLAAIRSSVPIGDTDLALELRVEEPEESESPRTISAFGIWGPREAAILKRLCSLLDARFYDAEAGSFVEL